METLSNAEAKALEALEAFSEIWEIVHEHKNELSDLLEKAESLSSKDFHEYLSKYLSGEQ